MLHLTLFIILGWFLIGASLEIFYLIVQNSSQERRFWLVGRALDSAFTLTILFSIGLVLGALTDRLVGTTELHLFALFLGILFSILFLSQRLLTLSTNYRLSRSHQ